VHATICRSTWLQVEQRHDRVVDELAKLLKRGGFNYRVEPVADKEKRRREGIDRRRADIEFGKPGEDRCIKALDVEVTSGCIGAAERAKTRKFTVAPAGAAHGVYREKCFYPVVVNPAGRLGDEGEKLLRRLLKTIAKKASDLSVGVERSSGFLRKLLSEIPGIRIPYLGAQERRQAVRHTKASLARQSGSPRLMSATPRSSGRRA